MFTDIYVSLQASRVLQEGWRRETSRDSNSFGWLIARLRRASASK
jgi:hypothetical protein